MATENQRHARYLVVVEWPRVAWVFHDFRQQVHPRRVVGPERDAASGRVQIREAVVVENFDSVATGHWRDFAFDARTEAVLAEYHVRRTADRLACFWSRAAFEEDNLRRGDSFGERRRHTQAATGQRRHFALRLRTLVAAFTIGVDVRGHSQPCENFVDDGPWLECDFAGLPRSSIIEPRSEAERCRRRGQFRDEFRRIFARFLGELQRVTFRRLAVGVNVDDARRFVLESPAYGKSQRHRVAARPEFRRAIFD